MEYAFFTNTGIVYAFVSTPRQLYQLARELKTHRFKRVHFHIINQVDPDFDEDPYFYDFIRTFETTRYHHCNY